MEYGNLDEILGKIDLAMADFEGQQDILDSLQIAREEIINIMDVIKERQGE